MKMNRDYSKNYRKEETKQMISFFIPFYNILILFHVLKYEKDLFEDTNQKIDEEAQKIIIQLRKYYGENIEKDPSKYVK